jgi:hypothetical protein
MKGKSLRYMNDVCFTTFPVVVDYTRFFSKHETEWVEGKKKKERKKREKKVGAKL